MGRRREGEIEKSNLALDLMRGLHTGEICAESVAYKAVNFLSLTALRHIMAEATRYDAETITYRSINEMEVKLEEMREKMLDMENDILR